MANELVAYSRAGDVFHYRWAARRCLHMIYPNNSLQSLVVEGSNETEKAGEYVIDVTEYHIIDGENHIDYFQLKHSTIQVDDPFTISDLKETFEGFAKRFIQHCGISLEPQDAKQIRFIILTNRLINTDFQQNVQEIALGNPVNNVFRNTIEKYTSLTSSQLQAFCGMIEFQQVAQNYLGQKSELQTEIAQLVAGSVITAEVEGITALVQEKVLPHSNHKIIREEILQKFGITSERQLYPAPPIWEKDTRIVVREEYQKLRNEILSGAGPFIVHAGGGVGKSVFCRHLVADLEEGSLAIVFDCFGAGDYRNPSTIRHGYHNALVQVCNELAARGLCPPLLAQNDSDENISRAFIQRIEISLSALKRAVSSAKLVLIIDAADNAEMAAKEFNQNCFAHGVLRERYPEDFKLVLSCRTERISLLQPQSQVLQLLLRPFSEKESLANLKNHFPSATQMDGDEFHRLTSGNPRVQANALDRRADSVAELLNILGPATITVEDLIKQQLQNAVNKMKDTLPIAFNEHIRAIGTGLAALPPHIPLKVLAAAAGVNLNLSKASFLILGDPFGFLMNQFSSEMSLLKPGLGRHSLPQSTIIEIT